MLGEDERSRVEAAIRAAETATAGEIVVVVARQAGSYKSLPFLTALIGALLVPWPLIWHTDLSAARIGVVQLATALVLLLATALAPGLALVPEALKRRRGREAAAREFAARGLAGTTGRTGVLIFVAEAERYAEVIGDSGIAARLDDGIWRDILTALVTALHAGRAGDGLVTAVEAVGGLLALHVPAGPGDADELPNRVILM